MPENTKSVETFLNPDHMRPWLIAAVIYIATFESLKDVIVTRVKDFFCLGFDEAGQDIIPDSYREKVLSRKNSPMYASLDWLREQGAIEEGDLQALERAKTLRNRLAHELLTVLWKEGLPTEFVATFDELVALLNKIEVWRIVNVEVPTNPDLDDVEVDVAEVIPGSIATLHMLLQVGLGDAEQSRSYHEEYVKRLAAREKGPGKPTSMA